MRSGGLGDGWGLNHTQTRRHTYCRTNRPRRDTSVTREHPAPKSRAARHAPADETESFSKIHGVMRRTTHNGLSGALGGPSKAQTSPSRLLVTLHPLVPRPSYTRSPRPPGQARFCCPLAVIFLYNTRRKKRLERTKKLGIKSGEIGDGPTRFRHAVFAGFCGRRQRRRRETPSLGLWGAKSSCRSLFASTADRPRLAGHSACP